MPGKRTQRATPKKRKKPNLREKLTALTTQAKKQQEKDRTRGEALLAVIRRKKELIADAFYDVGEALRELSQRKLYAALGHPSFAALVEERELMSVAQAHKLIEIVRRFGREQALHLGQEKAYAIARLAAVTSEPESPASLTEAGKIVGGKTVDELSVRDIEAVGKKRRAKKRRGGTLGEEERRAGEVHRGVSRWLRKKGAKQVMLTRVQRNKRWFLKLEIAVADVPKWMLA